jgi:hypothetical protein
MVSSGGGLDMGRFFAVVDQLIAMERGKPAAAAASTRKKP